MEFISVIGAVLIGPREVLVIVIVTAVIVFLAARKNKKH